jgi:ribosomal protein S18 acetylase RimI-like enzyme
VTVLWKKTPGIELNESDTPEAISTYLERNPGLSHVARIGRRIVGAALCGHDGRRGWIYHLAVAEDAQRRGIGQALIERCLAGLMEARIPRCNVFVLAGNPAGADFWRSRGWALLDDVVAFQKRFS